MSMQATIHDALVHGLEPIVLEVENESHRHNVPRGSETHFKVTVVSARFEGLPLVARHRRVHELLAEPLARGVHALSIHAYTPEQWQARGEAVPTSPPCLGGGRRPDADGA